MTGEKRVERYGGVVSLLKRCHDIAGRPTYNKIETFSRENSGRRGPEGVLIGPLAKSTANDILRGVHTRNLRWELVETLWAVLRLIAEERGLDTGGMPKRSDLHRCYYAGLSVPSVQGAGPAPALPDREHGRRPGDPLDATLSTLSPDPKSSRTDKQEAVGRLLADVRRRGAHAWWQKYAQGVPGWFGPYLTLEPQLSHVFSYTPHCVPELLQTREYACHVIANDWPDLTVDEVGRRVELRMLRRQVLHRTDPLHCWAVIEEAALLDPAVPDAVRLRQVLHLIELVRLPHITVQIARAGNAADAGVVEPTALMRFIEPGYGDLVYLEHCGLGLFLYENRNVADFTKKFFDLTIEALKPDESLELLRAIVDRLAP